MLCDIIMLLILLVFECSETHVRLDRLRLSSKDVRSDVIDTFKWAIDAIRLFFL